jgi:hypothetical protein
MLKFAAAIMGLIASTQTALAQIETWRFKQANDAYLGLPTATMYAKRTVSCPDVSVPSIVLQCEDYNGPMVHLKSDCFFYPDPDLTEARDISIDSGETIQLITTYIPATVSGSNGDSAIRFRDLGVQGQISVTAKDVDTFWEIADGESYTKLTLTPYLQPSVEMVFDLTDLGKAMLPVFAGCFPKLIPE